MPAKIKTAPHPQYIILQKTTPTPSSAPAARGVRAAAAAPDSGLRSIMVRVLQAAPGPRRPGQRAAGVAAARRPAAAADGCAWREPLRESCTLFPGINAAAADLSEDEKSQLEASGLVVVPNERRYVRAHSVRRLHAAEAAFYAQGGVQSHSGSPVRRLSDSPVRRLSDSPVRRLSDTSVGRLTASPLAAQLLGVLELLAAQNTAPTTEDVEDRDPALLWNLGSVGLYTGYRFTGEGVKVAVLDTGLNVNHPDFHGRVPAANCWNFLNASTNVADGDGHGTHCCGVIAARADSALGVRYSVAPDVDLLVGKVLDDGGSGFDSDILEGIAWAVHLGAEVISLSLGSPRRRRGAASAIYEQLAQDLYRGLNGRKCLLVAAAGNESARSLGRIAPVGNPAACDSYMAVAAIDEADRVADFSCGQRDKIGVLNVSAPGVAILSAYTAPDGEQPYAYLDGTSMATPHAAAVAALHLQAAGAASDTMQLWDMLERTCRPLGSPADYGRGCVQVPEL